MMTTKRKEALLIAVVVVVVALFLGGASAKTLAIETVGSPVLRQVSAPLSAEELKSPATLALVADMFETLANSGGGVGLAAPQVGVSARAFVVACNRTGVDPPLPPTALLNPELDCSESYGRARIALLEGCLSVPGLRALVPRWESVTLSAAVVDPSGGGGVALRRMRATGFVAGLLQHEFDHLQGVLYLDRMDASSLCTSGTGGTCEKYFADAGLAKGTWQWVD